MQVASFAVRKRRRRQWRLAAFTAAAALLLGIGGYEVFQHTRPVLIADGCVAKIAGQVIRLDPEQAAVAATIAGVAHRIGAPRAAVTVAFATALQESGMHNVGYGDRDSVGIFQQRPSQGWGTPGQLKDPVYAATKFFAALVRVAGYQNMPVPRAAQAVQHSADGTAYGQYEQVAAVLSAAFSGDYPRAVWCWYRPYPHSRARLGAVRTELTRTFGPQTLRPGAPGAIDAAHRVQAPDRARGAAHAAAVTAARTQTGWEIASWAVTHAKTYGIRQVRYAGFAWHASNGQRGWRRDAAAPAARVELG